MAQAPSFVLRLCVKRDEPLGQGVRFQEQGLRTVQRNPDSDTGSHF